jgi:hypothetical protein
MATPADVVAEAVALVNAWHDQAAPGAGGEPSVPWPEAGG